MREAHDTAESKDPYTRLSHSEPGKRILSMHSKSAVGAPSLRVLCARVGFHDRFNLRISPTLQPTIDSNCK
jgi:hypothetical protein